MKRVLLPYDFSPFARRALALVLSGVPYGPEVTVDALHVIDERLYKRPGIAPPSDAALEAYFRADVQRATTPERRVGEAPTLRVVRGKPTQEILARVGEYGGIIIGGQGHGGLGEKFLGTTAMRIVRDSPVSVYVAKKSQTLATPARLMCAVESDDSSRRALKEAQSLAKQCGATLSLLRALVQPPYYAEWPPIMTVPDMRSANDERDRLISFEVDTLGGTFATQHDVQFSAGGIASDITSRAALDRIDTIIVGARSETIDKRLLGSVSESVVQRAACDVYVVR